MNIKKKLTRLFLLTCLVVTLTSCGEKTKEVSKKLETNGEKTKEVSENRKTQDPNIPIQIEKKKNSNIIFSEFFKENKPIILYEVKKIDKEEEVYRYYIVQDNKIKEFNLDYNNRMGKTLGELSKMKDDEIIEMLYKLTPKELDTLNEDDKATVQKIKAEFENPQQYLSGIASSINVPKDIQDKAVMFSKHKELESKISDENLRSKINEINERVLSDNFRNSKFLPDYALMVNFKTVFYNVNDLNLSKYIEKPLHTVEYNVKVLKEAYDKVIQESGSTITKEDRKIIDDMLEYYEALTSNLLKYTKVEEKVNQILGILYSGHSHTMDNASKIVYNIKTDSSGNTAVGEEIHYFDKNNKGDSLDLYKMTDAGQLPVYDSIYMPVAGEKGDVYIRVSEMFSLSFDALDNKEVFVDATKEEIDKALESK
ncbi:hypothetical protein ACQRBF_05805 [Peptoniphilaceae bacterium SGI.131]